MTVKPITLNKWITISTVEYVLHVKLRNMTCQGLDRQGPVPSLYKDHDKDKDYVDLQGQVQGLKFSP